MVRSEQPKSYIVARFGSAASKSTMQRGLQLGIFPHQDLWQGYYSATERAQGGSHP